MSMMDTFSMPASGFGLFIHLHHDCDAVATQHPSRAARSPQDAAGLIEDPGRRVVKVFYKVQQTGELALLDVVAS
jgi:hypothetical protein